MDNLLLLTDSYKVSHWAQYPPGTETVYSYFESRGGKYDEVCFFGLQYFLKRYLAGEVVTKARIDEAAAYYEGHFPPGFEFNRKGWEHIVDEHKGRLPLTIKAVPEGTVVGVKNVLMTVENTDPKCFWLTNYVETLLVQVWHAMTVCTHSREQKKVIAAYLAETGDVGGLGFKLHDFGFRGVSSVESAGTGACAHLVNFLGTDTVAGLVVAREYYGCRTAGFSIPASEHSTITAWGRADEAKALENMLDPAFGTHDAFKLNFRMRIDSTLRLLDGADGARPLASASSRDRSSPVTSTQARRVPHGPGSVRVRLLRRLQGLQRDLGGDAAVEGFGA